MRLAGLGQRISPAARRSRTFTQVRKLAGSPGLIVEVSSESRAALQECLVVVAADAVVLDELVGGRQDGDGRASGPCGRGGERSGGRRQTERAPAGEGGFASWPGPTVEHGGTPAGAQGITGGDDHRGSSRTSARHRRRNEAKSSAICLRHYSLPTPGAPHPPVPVIDDHEKPYFRLAHDLGPVVSKPACMKNTCDSPGRNTSPLGERPLIVQLIGGQVDVALDVGVKNPFLLPDAEKPLVSNGEGDAFRSGTRPTEEAERLQWCSPRNWPTAPANRPGDARQATGRFPAPHRPAVAAPGRT